MSGRGGVEAPRGPYVLLAFLRHELLVQSRSLRFRAVVGGWIAAASLPAIVIFLRRGVGEAPSGATYLGETLPWLLPLSIVASFVIASDGILREHEQQTWPTLSLCGLGSAGYLLRRWFALLVPLLAASLVPLLVASGLGMAAGQDSSWSRLAWLWVLQVAPLVVLWSAAGLGFGTAGGGLFPGAGLAAIVTILVLWPLDAALFRFHLHLGAPTLEVARFARSLGRLQAGLRGTAGVYDLPYPLPASDAPITVGVEAAKALLPLVSTAALAALGLGWAVCTMRRVRPDLRPWKVRDTHSLVTFVRAADRLRERFAVDAGLAPGDRAAIAMAIALAVGTIGAGVVRDRAVVAEGGERFFLEQETWPGATPRDLAVVAVRLDGTVDAGGALRVASTLRLRDGGSSPAGSAALVLTPSLQIESLVAFGGHEVRWRRRRERIAVAFEPPLAPGEAAELRVVVSGRPARTVFALRGSFEYGTGFMGFQRSFGRYHYARFASDLGDLVPSFRVPAVAPTRVNAAATDLFPVPRFTPFGLASEVGWQGPLPREEEVLPTARVDVTLRVPRDRWIADACGHVALDGRLEGGCALPLGLYGLRGGSQVAETSQGLTVAILPEHRELARVKLGEISQVAEIVREVWPDEELLGDTVLLETPDELVFLRDGVLWSLESLMGEGDEARLLAQGRLLILPESILLAGPPLPPATLAQKIVTARLLQRRPVVAGQALLFRSLVAALAAQRAGQVSPDGAVMPATNLGPAPYQVSLLTADSSEWAVWRQRLPALLLDLGHRIGDDAVRRGLAAFLARRDAPPGTLEELVGDWERAGGVPLGGFYSDYLAGDALPSLSLADVGFAPAAGGWRVRGRVVNSATGEARCTVVLTSEMARTSVEVVVPSRGSAPVELASASAPRALLLDPENRCHRYRPLVPPPVERVDYRGVAHG